MLCWVFVTHSDRAASFLYSWSFNFFALNSFRLARDIENFLTWEELVWLIRIFHASLLSHHWAPPSITTYHTTNGALHSTETYSSSRLAVSCPAEKGPNPSGGRKGEAGGGCTPLEWSSAPGGGPRNKHLDVSWERAGCPGMCQDMERDCSGQINHHVTTVWSGPNIVS